VSIGNSSAYLIGSQVSGHDCRQRRVQESVPFLEERGRDVAVERRLNLERDQNGDNQVEARAVVVV